MYPHEQKTTHCLLRPAFRKEAKRRIQLSCTIKACLLTWKQQGEAKRRTYNLRISAGRYIAKPAQHFCGVFLCPAEMLICNPAARRTCPSMQSCEGVRRAKWVCLVLRVPPSSVMLKENQQVNHLFTWSSLKTRHPNVPCFSPRPVRIGQDTADPGVHEKPDAPSTREVWPKSPRVCGPTD